MLIVRYCYRADVAKLADALDLGSSAERRGSSSLPVRTTPPITSHKDTPKSLLRLREKPIPKGKETLSDVLRNFSDLLGSFQDGNIS